MGSGGVGWGPTRGVPPREGPGLGQRGGNLPPSTGQEASGVRTTQGWDEEPKKA